MFMRKFAKGLLLLVVLSILAVAILPLKAWLEKRLTAYAEAQGFNNVHLTVSHLGFGGISLENISVGEKTPLTLKNFTLGYSLPDLWGGSLHELSLSGLALAASKQDQKWMIPGLENWPGDSKNNAPTLIPVTNEQLAAFPLNALKLEDSNLHIASGPWQMDVPLQVVLKKEPAPEFSYKATGIKFKAQSISMTTGDASIKASLKPEGKKWDGAWQLKDVQIAGGDSGVPALSGSGTLSVQADTIEFQGQLGSDDKTYSATFRANYLLNALEKSGLTLAEVTMPWNSGTLSAQDINIPFGASRPLNINLKVQHISLGAVMQQFTGNKASATGVISGTLPVTIGTDGSIILQQGKLLAEEPGIIAMSPDAIPGDNDQVALARDILKNLHYTLLSIGVDNDKDNKLSLLMKLEGSNPDVSAGRPVKLSVHLTGDVLNLIQQNMTALTDPKKLLEQGNNAK
jgi:hypothetical protein